MIILKCQVFNYWALAEVGEILVFGFVGKVVTPGRFLIKPEVISFNTD